MEEVRTLISDIGKYLACVGLDIYSKENYGYPEPKKVPCDLIIWSNILNSIESDLSNKIYFGYDYLNIRENVLNII